MPPWIHRGERPVRATRFLFTFPGPLGASQKHSPPWLSLFDKWGMLIIVNGRMQKWSSDCLTTARVAWSPAGERARVTVLEQDPQDRAHFCVLASNAQLGPRGKASGERHWGKKSVSLGGRGWSTALVNWWRNVSGFEPVVHMYWYLPCTSPACDHRISVCIWIKPPNVQGLKSILYVSLAVFHRWNISLVKSLSSNHHQHWYSVPKVFFRTCIWRKCGLTLT